MNERKNATMLQRLPVILAVTAASYGLVSQAQGQHAQRDSRARQAMAGAAASLAPVGTREEEVLQA